MSTVTKTPAATPLRVPDEGIVGLARDFADLYSAYLESPRAFFYFAFLTYFGALTAKKITLASALRPEPRLYTVLLGESADSRKSTALSKTKEFFESLDAAKDLPVLLGLGSAEGLAERLKRADESTLLLQFDELKAFVDKARNEASLILPAVSSLFEHNEYENITKDRHVKIEKASVSLLAACTRETYGRLFDSRFLDMGFLNRLWIVADGTERRVAIPKVIPENKLEPLRNRVRGLLRAIDKRPRKYPVTAGALKLFERWYREREGSIFARRLDTYGHRLMVLLTATSERDAADERVVEAVIALLDYELEARRECDPIDAENAIAALEEKVRRALARGPLRKSELKRKVNYARYGIWQWDTACRNLEKAGEIHSYDGLVHLTRRPVPASPPASRPQRRQKVNDDVVF